MVKYIFIHSNAKTVVHHLSTTSQPKFAISVKISIQAVPAVLMMEFALNAVKLTIWLIINAILATWTILAVAHALTTSIALRQFLATTSEETLHSYVKLNFFTVRSAVAVIAFNAIFLIFCKFLVNVNFALTTLTIVLNV
jgi:hypothetical protein